MQVLAKNKRSISLGLGEMKCLAHTDLRLWTLNWGMGFSYPLLNLFQIKSVSARPWHTYPLHKFCLFLHNIQLQSKQAWADKLLEKLKPQTYPDIWAGHQCTFSLFKSSITWLYVEKNLKNFWCNYIFDSLSQFFLFSLFWAHLTHNWQKTKKIVFIEIFDCNLSHWIPLVTINLISKFIKIGF